MRLPQSLKALCSGTDSISEDIYYTIHLQVIDVVFEIGTTFEKDFSNQIVLNINVASAPVLLIGWCILLIQHIAVIGVLYMVLLCTSGSSHITSPYTVQPSNEALRRSLLGSGLHYHLEHHKNKPG